MTTRPPASKLLPTALLSLGVVLYLISAARWFPEDHKHAGSRIVVPWLVIIGLAASLFPPRIHLAIAAWLDRFRHPSTVSRRVITLVVWIISAVYLGLTALRQHRDFNFRIQDEMMYLVQMRMLAQGQLYMPAHPMADFFQTFYIFTKPVYASMYFPGASLMFVPAVWLHLPIWIIPLLICGGVVGMTYRVTAELTDGVWGMLAAMLVVGVPTVRTLSLLTLSYMPMALLGLLLVWAYLRFHRRRGVVWAGVIGLLAGWGAVTRPLDAICFALPVGVGMLVDLRRETAKRVAGTLVVIGVCALPMLSLQLVLNRAVTGSLWRTPIQKYEELYWPGAVFGLHPHMSPEEHPLATNLPQFRDDYEHFVLPFFTGRADKIPHPWRQTFEWTLPQTVLIILLPLGVLGLRKRRWVLWSALAIYPLAYVTWVMFLPYYAAVVAPITAFAVVVGASQLIESFPNQRAPLTSFISMALLLLAIVSLPEISGPDKTTSSPVMQSFNQQAQTIHEPAVVFFRYPDNDPMAWRHEQTYNIDAADIDDERIVRAQDLGVRNIELVRYYQRIGQHRRFYIFDQKTRVLSDWNPTE